MTQPFAGDTGGWALGWVLAPRAHRLSPIPEPCRLHLRAYPSSEGSAPCSMARCRMAKPIPGSATTKRTLRPRRDPPGTQRRRGRSMAMGLRSGIVWEQAWTGNGHAWGWTRGDGCVGMGTLWEWARVGTGEWGWHAW